MIKAGQEKLKNDVNRLHLFKCTNCGFVLESENDYTLLHHPNSGRLDIDNLKDYYGMDYVEFKKVKS